MSKHFCFLNKCAKIHSTSYNKGFVTIKIKVKDIIKGSVYEIKLHFLLVIVLASLWIFKLRFSTEAIYVFKSVSLKLLNEGFFFFGNAKPWRHTLPWRHHVRVVRAGVGWGDGGWGGRAGLLSCGHYSWNDRGAQETTGRLTSCAEKRYRFCSAVLLGVLPAVLHGELYLAFSAQQANR